MAGTRTKLTKKNLDASQPGEKTYNIFDSEIRGFGVQIQPKGTKTFFLKFSFQRRQYWITIGQFGRELTLDQARELAQRKRADIANGRNPAAERKLANEGATIRELAKRFIEEHVAPKLKVKTLEIYTWHINKHILPVIGSLKVRSVGVADVRAIHHKLRKTPRTANIVANILSRMLGLAEQWGMREQNSNPCGLVERFQEPKRVCRLEDEDLLALGKALDEEAANPRGSGLYPVAMIRLLIFTGARRGEILGLRWDELNATPGRERIVKRTHKTDRTSGAKVIPLNEEAISVLIGIPKVLEADLVFPYNVIDSAECALKRAWTRVRVAAGLPSVRIHDIRHIFASVAIDAGVSEEVIGGILGQKTRDVTARYAHLGQSSVRAGAVTVGNILALKLKEAN